MKLKDNVSKNYAFIPKISEASRKIANRRLKTIDATVPHFMRDIKCRTIEPLAPIPTNSDKPIVTEDKAEDPKDQEPLVEESVSSKPQETNVNKPSVYNLRTGKMTAKSDVFLDDNIFTFRPKVSTASQKIVQNLGTDFMARQQQHLDRQKRNIEQASIHFSSYNGRLSPVSKLRKFKKVKEGAEDGDINNSADDQVDGVKGQGEDTESSDGKDVISNKNVSPNLQRILEG